MKSASLMMAAAICLAVPAMAHAETRCEDLAKTVLPHAEVTKATTETYSGKTLCKVAVASHPTQDSNILLEVWIPVEA